MGKALETITVIKTGLLTSVQDQGRPDLLHLALSRAGAMDAMQMALANRLVGNPPDSAGLEFTGVGPTLYFDQPACIGWTGGVMSARLIPDEGSECAVPSHRPVMIPARSTLRFGACTAGFRCWFAVSGGLDVQQLLGSRSQHLAADIGPPRITANASLSVGRQAASAFQAVAQALDRDPQSFEQKVGAKKGTAMMRSTRWFLPTSVPFSWPLIELCALPGRHLELLSQADRQHLLTQAWKVSPRSNRQGLGLEGTPINPSSLGNLLSEPIREGTVQLPPAGFPFILLAEHQSTGGYPRVLEVIGAMSPELAQAGPSARIVFKLVDIDAADLLRQERRFAYQTLVSTVESKLAL